MSLYTHLLRPLLFRLPPERAQRLAERALAQPWLWAWLAPLLRVQDSRLRVSLAGIPLPNPVGLAAGYDKDCRALPGLASLGFGYLVGGTVFPTPRQGNPKPRLLRLPREEALINALGFPSKGVQAVVKTLEQHYPPTATLPFREAGAGRRPARHPRPSPWHTQAPLIVSIAALDVEGFARCYELVEPRAGGVELNISSPNTAGISVFQEPAILEAMLKHISGPRRDCGGGCRKPLFVKLPAARDDASREGVLALAEVCRQGGVDGVTAGNARPVEDPRMKVGRGGLSGRPLLEETLRTVAAIRDRVGGDLAIAACGGIFTGEDAFHALQAGANTVQLLTALVYRGPGVVKSINQELLACLEREGIASVGAMTGATA